MPHDNRYMKKSLSESKGMPSSMWVWAKYTGPHLNVEELVIEMLSLEDELDATPIIERVLV